jgi:hypothetical protein
VAYCKVEDLLVGSTALPKGMEPQAYVDGAADEIDMRIGFTYVTPVDISETSPVERPVRLILKTLNVHLATGRLCLAMAKNAQRTDLEPYGASLVRDALAMIGQIERGEITLIGAVRVVRTGEDPAFTGPQIFNQDAESNVEAFYDRVSNPNYFYCGLPRSSVETDSGLVA